MTRPPDPDDDRISSIRNLGPAMEQAFLRAGIHSARTLRDIGADEGYARLLAAGHAPHFIGYYALVMGLQGRPWNDCRGKEKDELRARFDAIVAQNAARTGLASDAHALEAILDQIGTGQRR